MFSVRLADAANSTYNLFSHALLTAWYLPASLNVSESPQYAWFQIGVNGSATAWNAASLIYTFHVGKAELGTTLFTNYASLKKKVTFLFAVKAVLTAR